MKVPQEGSPVYFAPRRLAADGSLKPSWWYTRIGEATITEDAAADPASPLPLPPAVEPVAQLARAMVLCARGGEVKQPTCAHPACETKALILTLAPSVCCHAGGHARLLGAASEPSQAAVEHRAVPPAALPAAGLLPRRSALLSSLGVLCTRW